MFLSLPLRAKPLLKEGQRQISALEVFSCRGQSDRDTYPNTLVVVAIRPKKSDHCLNRLAHALSLEAGFNLPHENGVGVLLPLVLSFQAPVAPQKLRQMAAAMSIVDSESETFLLAAVVARIYASMMGSAFREASMP
jgi:alcohol dehydrogenase YqhD (iron-dependent ADH family)